MGDVNPTKSITTHELIKQPNQNSEIVRPNQKAEIVRLYTVFRKHPLDSKIHFHFERMKKSLSHANSHHKKVGVATQVADKMDFKTKILEIKRNIL